MKALIIGLAIIIGSSLTPVVGRAERVGTKRTDLQRHDLSIPGREIVQTRVEIAPGAASPKHWHPGEEIIYVLEGSLEYQIADRTPVTLKAGDVFFIPSRAIHTAKNVGTSPGVELATYVVEKGKPLVSLVK
jgi:quercetin dioxygenase-like cupin family protein